ARGDPPGRHGARRPQRGQRDRGGSLPRRKAFLHRDRGSDRPGARRNQRRAAPIPRAGLCCRCGGARPGFALHRAARRRVLADRNPYLAPRMSLLITIVSFLVTVGVLVVVHEFGHYLAARWSGVKILRFSVGFGKPLVIRRRGPDATE